MKKLLVSTIVLISVFCVLGTAKEAHAQTSCPVTPTSPNTVSFTATIPVSGTYTVWNRLIASDTTNNSFFLQVDGGCAIVVGDGSTIPANQFTWVNFQDGNTASPISITLSAGTHTVLITEREGGVGVDTLFFTDTPCIPTGFGDNCQGFVTATPAPTNAPTPTPNVQTYTLNPIADSYVSSKSSNKNYGTTNILNVDGNPVNIAYLKFDLTPLAGKRIISANLRIRTSTDTSTNQQRIKSVSNTTWGETTIKYKNRPTVSNTVLGTINTSGAANTWQVVPLSSIASEAGKVFSLAIDTSGSDNIWFFTRESTSKPKLVIQAQ